jgi:hypothetical protein
MERLKRLIHEIHRRSLWQVLLIYVGGALVAYQAVQALTEGLGLPQWFPGLAVVLFVIGLPFVVATAFVREGEAPSPAPAEAEASMVEAEAAAARHEARRHRRFLTWRNAGLSFMAALAVWGVVATGWMLFGGRPARPFPFYAGAAALTGLELPEGASPTVFMLSVLIIKVGSAAAFVLILYLARETLGGHWLAIGPSYSWTEAIAGILSETVYCPLAALAADRILRPKVSASA